MTAAVSTLVCTVPSGKAVRRRNTVGSCAATVPASTAVACAATVPASTAVSTGDALLLRSSAIATRKALLVWRRCAVATGETLLRRIATGKALLGWMRCTVATGEALLCAVGSVRIDNARLGARSHTTGEGGLLSTVASRLQVRL
jgi:hypothetical protein